jgi:hypothetical protein
MNKDGINVKSSEVAEIPKVHDENAILLQTPYYWSWYRCIFSRQEARAGDGQVVRPKEKQ